MLPWLVVLALSYLPLFWLLGHMPVQSWDEARTGVNGLGILQHQDWVVMRHVKEPDLWNCKPPLHAWTLAASFYLLGANEWALRLPSALAALATVLLVFRAAWWWLGSWRGGLLAALVLLTTQGYVTTHIARSGDFDAPLTLWTTLGALSWLRYLIGGRPAYAWLTGGAFTLAVLTKGIAGAVFGPGLLLAAVLTGYGHRLRNWQPWAAGALALVAAAVWYAVREAAEPGYLDAVWQYEIGGPATAQLEGHRTSVFMYLNTLTEYKFTVWLLPALAGWLLGWWQPRGSREWVLSRATAAIAGSFLLLISLVQTRLLWYDAPVYPLLAIQAAAGLVWLGRTIAAHWNRPTTPTTRTLAVLAVALFPYLSQWRYIDSLANSPVKDMNLLYGYLIHDLPRQLPNLHKYVVMTDGVFNDSPVFYAAAAQHQFGHQSRVRTPWGIWPDPGEIIVACGAKARKPWQKRFVTQELARTDSCVTLRLVERR
ncbi:phospholipid carrier-dependent glycosyltransferase [Hymenobacter busanensis]|uniref:Phospholipid carrier-dependent glycosyltransferase n=1 Tax=Hymenobacter busanensis TaxID=2607656 RepID=A0A7L4ZYI9_9BACT|nr:glycosyltransferase family 39 protein [Hymenobacter busanensis]KAA9333216.1 phospholipid carrier-dependent glycosyltransferase [Hymenobacter busanensis]QHJ08107.1 phospholipid carrier-dependent glycosyltransferase [Hymenobacter busanensis]